MPDSTAIPSTPSADSDPSASDETPAPIPGADRKPFVPPRLRREAMLTRATAERSFRFGTASMS